MKALNRQELEEAKQWADAHLPKSAILWVWLKLNLDQPGGKGTSENAMCYADCWPRPNIIAGVDRVESYHLDHYPMMVLFTDLTQNETEKLERFLLELSEEIGFVKVGGVQPQAVNDEWIPVFTKVFAHHLGFNASGAIWPCRAYCLMEPQRQLLRSKTIQAPEGFEFQRLLMSDCEFVDASWPHRFVGSMKLMERRIRDLPNVGLREATGQKRLVSFELINDLAGVVNHLYTVPEFRRRGLGTAVELKLLQVMLEQDYFPVKTVVRGNVAGEKVTDGSAWWTYFGDVSWLRYGDERLLIAYKASDPGQPLCLEH